MELDEPYCDVILMRWATPTGKQPTLEATGETFEDAKSSRLNARGSAAAPA
jgi:hypothetical protein